MISFLNKTGSNLKKLNLSDTKITLSGVGLLSTTFHNLEELLKEYDRCGTDLFSEQGWE